MVCVRVNPGPAGGPEAAQSRDRPALRPPRTFDSPPARDHPGRVDDIIDLGAYLRRREEGDKAPRTAFAVWGGDGERARFSLPLWRVVYLSGGTRGGLVWVPSGDDRPARLRPFVVLDLSEDPARTRFAASLVHGMKDCAAPTLREEGEEGLTVYLGEQDERCWYVVVDEIGDSADALEGRVRDDILFLAGECAGLLFFRGFATEAGDGE